LKALFSERQAKFAGEIQIKAPGYRVTFKFKSPSMFNQVFNTTFPDPHCHETTGLDTPAGGVSYSNTLRVPKGRISFCHSLGEYSVFFLAATQRAALDFQPVRAENYFYTKRS
jgi:hypothetical protein